MKKILLTLATLSILTACSSANKVEDNHVKEIPKVLQSELETTDSESVSNETRTIYDKDGVIITAKGNSVTLVMPTDVVFDFDKSDLKPEFEPVLDLIADALDSNKEISSTIEGHTDSIGGAVYNNKLSVTRAEKAKEYLVKNEIDSSRIETVGHGFKNPVASNNSESGRSRNRRIEITLTK